MDSFAAAASSPLTLERKAAITALKIAAMGDIMLDRAVGRHFRERPQDFRMEDIAARLHSYDLIFANLENPVGVNGTPHPTQNRNVTFRCHPDALQVLDNLGVTVVSLGNNHMLDFGPVALSETLDCLDARGIRHAGAGRNYEEANRPLLLEINGRKVAILAYVFLYSASTQMATRNRAGVSDHRMRNILPRIRELVRQGYQVLVSAHWGREYCFYPVPYQMAQARRMIDEGASMVIGHGPHYPQGMESHAGGRIIYSLGNFIFDEPFRYANRSFIYGAEFGHGGALVAEQILPLHIHNHVPALVEGPYKARLEKLTARLSRLYRIKSRKFWQHQNSLYFRDIMYRVSRMKSLKFLFLPPLSFYWSVGFRNYGRKLLPARFKKRG